jgi:hypothetical protein
MPTSARTFKRFLIATILIAFFAFSSGAYAQKTFKCGNVYSETPCVGGVAVDTQDNRTREQKNQADATTARTADAAAALEKERLAREKKEEAANKKTGAATNTASVKRSPFKPLQVKKPKPDKAQKAAKTPKAPKPPKPAKKVKNSV